jgi:hypothetical protein
MCFTLWVSLSLKLRQFKNVNWFFLTWIRTGANGEITYKDRKPHNFLSLTCNENRSTTVILLCSVISAIHYDNCEWLTSNNRILNDVDVHYSLCGEIYNWENPLSQIHSNTIFFFSVILIYVNIYDFLFIYFLTVSYK